MLIKTLITLSALLLTFYSTSATQAALISYTIRGAANGSLGGTEFNHTSFELTAKAETNDVFELSLGFQVINIEMSISIVGFETAIFTNETGTTSNQSNFHAGFGDNDQNRAIAFVGNDIFGTYDLSTSIGPTSGSVSMSPFTSFPTTAGNLLLSTVRNAIFSAFLIPEPTTLTLATLSLLAIAYRPRSCRRSVIQQ